MPAASPSPRPALFLVLTLAATAVAAQAPPLSPAMLAAVKGHTLTAQNVEPVIEALRELSAAMVADPDVAKASMARMKLPAEQQVRELEIDPMASRVLKAHGVTAQDYVVGVLALRAAGAAAGSPLAAAASPANVTFLQAHPDVLDRFRAAERGQ